MNRLTASLILSAILLIETIISRAITGSAMHQALLLAAVIVFFSVQWIGKRTARSMGTLLAVTIALGGWWMMKAGVAPILLSELPPAFHFAVGVHFWAWSRFSGSGRENISAAGCLVLLAAAGVVVWTLGQVEVYGSSILGVRIQAVAVLAGSLVLAWRWGGEALGAGSETAIEAKILRPREQPRRMARYSMVAFVMALVLAGAAWSMGLSDKAALLSFEWLSRDGKVTELSDFGNENLVFANSGGPLDGATRQLPKRANIRLDDSVRFHLQFDDSKQFEAATRRPLYLRTSAMAFFSSDGRMGPRRQGAWIYDSDDGVEDGITVLANATGDAAGFDFWTLIDRKDAMGIPLMPSTETVGVSAVYGFADDWYQLALGESQERVRYKARATPIRWRDLAGRANLAKGDAPSDYLQLPAGKLTNRILADAQEAAPRTESLAHRLEGIEQLVAARCRYSLHYQNPDDLEPVENFFYGEQQGHCELFAVGTVMLLRAIGVPSRVAFGYCGGISTAKQRLFAFRESDFHAWAEIFLEDYGWVVFDTTPHGSGAVMAAKEQPGSPAFRAIEPNGYEDLGSERLLGQVEISFLSRFIADAIDWVARWFVAFCLGGAGLAMALLGWGQWKGGKSGVSASESTRSGISLSKPAAISGLLSEYLKACEELGQRKAPGQTLNEFLSRLKREGVCGDELDEMNAYLYRVQYAGVAPDAAMERDFRQKVEALLVSPFSEQGTRT